MQRKGPFWWLSSLLRCCFRISISIDHVPGITNDVADSLSRSSDPLSLGFEASEEFSVAWNSFSASPKLSLSLLKLSSVAFSVPLVIAQLCLAAAAVKLFARLQFDFTAGRIEQRSALHPILFFLP